MQLSAIVTKDELSRVIASLFPMRVDLDARGSRNVTLERAPNIELVPDAGVRVGGDARLEWEVAALSVPVTVHTWQLLLVPSIARRDRDFVLAFEPILEQLDLRNVPGFVDDRIVSFANDVLLAQRSKLVWNFSRTLGITRALPPRVSRGRFELRPTGGQVVVTVDALRLSIALTPNVVREVTSCSAPPSSRRLAPRSAARLA